MSEFATDAPEPKHLHRNRSDRMLAGVCGGLARYFEIHPAVFRVAFVVLTLLGGAGILIYLAAALVMPDDGKEDSVATAALRDRRDRPWPLIGLGLVAAAGAMVLSTVSLWPRGDAWVFLLIAGVVILWITRYGVAGGGTTAAPELAAEDSRRVRRLLRRLAIAVAAIVTLLLMLAAVFVAVFDVHLGRGVGERTYVVAGVSDLRSDYRLGVGDLRLDLGSIAIPVGETHVDARVDVGELRVIVPGDVALRVRADAELGEIDLLGETSDGHEVEAQLDQTGARVLVLDAHVGVGALQITRAVR
jgi:phage shock protein PspC (stress-responsive transcriptional regulator)